MLSKYVKSRMIPYIDSLVQAVRYARMLGWPLIYIYKHSYACTNDAKHNVWN